MHLFKPTAFMLISIISTAALGAPASTVWRDHGRVISERTEAKAEYLKSLEAKVQAKKHTENIQKKPLANKKPLAHKKPLAVKKPLTHKRPVAHKSTIAKVKKHKPVVVKTNKTLVVINKSGHKSNHPQHQPVYSYGNRSYSKGYDYKPVQWQFVSDFRSRKGKDVDRTINVNERVIALELEGRKRDLIIDRAYAELGNGRVIRLHGLEGYLEKGDHLRHRLNNARFVERVVFEINATGYKRGYARLSIR